MKLRKKDFMMQKIKLSQLLNKSLDALLLTFFNINVDGSHFSIEGSFKESKFSKIGYDKTRQFTDVANKLTNYYELPFYVMGSVYQCQIENDLALSFEQLIIKLRTLISVQIARLEQIDLIDNKIALAISILRGSPDFNRHYIAVDVKRENETDIYLDSLFRILASSEQLMKYLNWNFRDLQRQFVDGTNQRNTQLRINLRWLVDNILDEFKAIHEYKYELLMANLDKIGELPKTNKMYETFFNRLSFYRQEVVGKDLTVDEINILRNELFDEKNPIPQRSLQIKAFVKNTTEDCCSACKNTYQIADRSFIVPKDGRYFFEYHHVIAFSNNRHQLDVPDNVVKLCPTCHRAMTPNRADDAYQQKLIKNILQDRNDILAFSQAYFKTESMQETVIKIHHALL